MAAGHVAGRHGHGSTGGDSARFGRALPASTAAGTTACDGRAAARAPVSGSGGRACRYHAGRREHPCVSGVREDRRDAGGNRPVHAAAPDGRICHPRFIAPPGRRRGLRHRGHTRRGPGRAGGRWVAAIRPAGRARGPARGRAAAAGPAGPARIPGEFPVPDRPDRVPHRRRYPGGRRAAPRHAGGHCHGQEHPGQAPGGGARAAAGARGRCGGIGRGHRDRAGCPLGRPPDPGPADRGDRRDHREPDGGSGGARRRGAGTRPARAAAPGAARARLA